MLEIGSRTHFYDLTYFYRKLSLPVYEEVVNTALNYSLFFAPLRIILSNIDFMSPYTTNFFWLCFSNKIGLYHNRKK